MKTNEYEKIVQWCRKNQWKEIDKSTREYALSRGVAELDKGLYRHKLLYGNYRVYVDACRYHNNELTKSFLIVTMEMKIEIWK